VVSEKKASVNNRRQEVAEVAEVMSHDFGRRKEGLELAKNTGEETGHSTIRRRAGWLGEKQE
jgi:hypothetical protein